MSRQLTRLKRFEPFSRSLGSVRGRLGVTSVVSLVVFALGSFALASPVGARVLRIKKPGAPINMVIVPTNGGGNVSWSPPISDGGSPITGYQVAAGHFASCSTPGTSCSLTGLVNGKRYFVAVRAVNAIGLGKKARVAFIAGQAPNCGNLTPGADLEYCNLKFADLAADKLAGADFHGASLFHTDFQGADLTDATFTAADLNYANFTGATLNGTVFDTADPSLSDFIVSGGITGVPAVLPPDFTLVDGYLVGPVANLSGANLAGAALVGQQLIDTDLASADLAGTDLDNANLTGANLTGADVTGTVFTGATWSNTTCPDGTNSNSDANTCLNNL
jgi:hypothetical protein